MNYNEEYIRQTLKKLERSKVQLDDILLFNEKAWKENKIQIIPKMCEDKKGYEFYTNDFTNSNLLEEISVRIGEFIHNLRSILDNLIFGFARMRLDPPLKPNKLSFPIYIDESEFNNKTKDIFSQIPEILKEEIIKYQPFSIQKKSKLDINIYPLLIVHTLNNIDKHRVPIIMFANLKEVKFNGFFEFDNENFTETIDEKNGFFQFYPIIPNSKIFEFRTLEKIENMKMDFNVSIEIAIDYPNNKLNLDIVENLYKFICYIVESLILVLENKNNCLK